MNIWFRFVVLRPWCNNWDFRADTHFTIPWLTSPPSVSIWNVHLNFIARSLSPRSHAHLYIVQFCYTSIFYLFWVSTTTKICDFWTHENILKYVRMDVQLCAFTFSAPPSANPTHPLGRNEATCATALFLLNTNTFQQNTKICTNTFQLLSCLPFYSAHVAITSPTPTVLSPFLLCQQTHKTHLNTDVALSQIWPLCFFLPPPPKMSPNLCYLHYNAK